MMNIQKYFRTSSETAPVLTGEISSRAPIATSAMRRFSTVIVALLLSCVSVSAGLPSVDARAADNYERERLMAMRPVVRFEHRPRHHDHPRRLRLFGMPIVIPDDEFDAAQAAPARVAQVPPARVARVARPAQVAPVPPPVAPVARIAQVVPQNPLPSRLQAENYRSFAIVSAPGTGAVDSPKVITTPEQLAEIAVIVNDSREDSLAKVLFGESTVITDKDVHLVLGADISLFGYLDRWVDPAGNARKGWSPIGQRTMPFSSHFYGAGHTIEYVNVDSERSEDGQGLFGVTKRARIYDLRIQKVIVNGRQAVGALVGLALNQTRIKDVYAENVRVVGKSAVGGLIGLTSGGCRIERSYARAKVVGTSSSVGGLIGFSKTSYIVRSYSIGIVKLNLPSGENDYQIGKQQNAGGLVGTARTSNIDTSYTDVEVLGVNNTGGIVGSIKNGSVVDSYAVGNVVHKNYYPSAAVGGIAGKSQCSTISRVYSTGGVESWFKSAFVGGLVGVGVHEDEGRCTTIINQSLAMNRHVWQTSGGSIDYLRVGRIVGSAGIYVKLDNNFAWSGMRFGSAEAEGTANEVKNRTFARLDGINHSKKHGESVKLADFLLSDPNSHWFAEDHDHWIGWKKVSQQLENADKWSFGREYLPKLVGIPQRIGQARVADANAQRELPHEEVHANNNSFARENANLQRENANPQREMARQSANSQQMTSQYVQRKQFSRQPLLSVEGNNGLISTHMVFNSIAESDYRNSLEFLRKRGVPYEALSILIENRGNLATYKQLAAMLYSVAGSPNYRNRGYSTVNRIDYERRAVKWLNGGTILPPNYRGNFIWDSHPKRVDMLVLMNRILGSPRANIIDGRQYILDVHSYEGVYPGGEVSGVAHWAISDGNANQLSRLDFGINLKLSIDELTDFMVRVMR
jgi:hypothetical protein